LGDHRIDIPTASLSFAKFEFLGVVFKEGQLRPPELRRVERETSTFGKHT